ncbi:AbrB/MazE/SpoVT family DNA-binding domain-containing protein [Salinarimonas sp.]|uniref:AbrB/MazE/SpoVT family DNA-binding domain-containing protein n=1 Tax=Salinarimonas sp. TaxID=2766526 RepID=UPI0032D931FE
MSVRKQSTTVVSSKGQVILPKEVRSGLDWAPGTRLVVEETPEGDVLLRKAPAFSATRFEDVFGCLPWDGPAKSIEEMDEAVLAEAKRRARD